MTHSDQLASVQQEERDEIITATIAGEVDLSNAQQLAREFIEIPNRVLGLVVDISGVEYLDSTGIALFYELHLRLGRRGQTLVIVAPAGGPPRRVLELAAFDRQATLADSVEAALSLVRERSAPSGSQDAPGLKTGTNRRRRASDR